LLLSTFPISIIDYNKKKAFEERIEFKSVACIIPSLCGNIITILPVEFIFFSIIIFSK